MAIPRISRHVPSVVLPCLLALGFRPFDPSKAGVRGDAAWIEKANGETYPPLQLPPGSP